MTFNGRATARESDKVTCGKPPDTYVIVGGVSDVFDIGRLLVAFTYPGHIVSYAPGDSFPCRRDAS